MSWEKEIKCKARRTFFRNEFNKFNYTGARILDSFYHMTLKLIKNRYFENVKIFHLLHNVITDVIT